MSLARQLVFDFTALCRSRQGAQVIPLQMEELTVWLMAPSDPTTGSQLGHNDLKLGTKYIKNELLLLGYNSIALNIT